MGVAKCNITKKFNFIPTSLFFLEDDHLMTETGFKVKIKLVWEQQ